MSEGCVDCKLKDLKAETLAKETSQKIQALEAEKATAVKVAEEAAKQAPKVTFPSVKEFMSHCQDGSCGEHKGELESWLKEHDSEVIKNIPREVIEARAEALGLVPKKIVITTKMR